jgi:hypothetical protein
MIQPRNSIPRSVGRFVLTMMALGFAAHLAGAQSGRVVVRPVDTGGALINPGMGWVLHYYDNLLTQFGNYADPQDTHDFFPGMSVAYFRLAWGYIEPEKGKFNWSIVDGPAQRFIARGWQVAFRFSCYEGHTAQTNAAPPWLRELGANGEFTKEEDSREYWQPRYDDPVFLKHLEEFLAAAARRYDGNPNVAWIDVGSFGMWGEGHTSGNYSRETRRQHIALHTKHFKQTLVAVNDDLGKERGQPNRLDDLIGAAPNLALRDDSILVNPAPKAYRSAFLAEPFWPRQPVILESAHYSLPRGKKYWDDGALYAESMEAYRGSYISVHDSPRRFWDENQDFIRRMNLRMGYRLNLLEAAWPAKVAAQASFAVSTKWKNVGVAPCYPGGYVALTLKAANGIVTTFVDETWNLRELGVDQPGSDSKIVQYNDAGPRQDGKDPIRSLALPVPGSAPVKELQSAFAFCPMVKPGTYEVFISVGSRDGTPQIALPLAEGDGQRRYRLGQLTVAAP